MYDLWEVGVDIFHMHCMNQRDKVHVRPSYSKHCSDAFVYVYLLVQSDIYIWNYLSSYTNRIFHVLREVGSLTIKLI